MLRTEVREEVVEAEESVLVLGGKPVTESGWIGVGEVSPGVEGSAA